MIKLMLAVLFFLSTFAHAADLTVPIKIARVPFTGEHFMFKDQEEGKKQFRKLFEQGRLEFSAFLPREDKPGASEFQLDSGSKVPIGHDVYLFHFKNTQDLHTFARMELKDAAPYDFAYSTVPFGLLTGIRDYAIGTKDQELMEILLAKKQTPSYQGSANEGKAKIYAPLEKALKK